MRKPLGKAAALGFHITGRLQSILIMPVIDQQLCLLLLVQIIPAPDSFILLLILWHCGWRLCLTETTGDVILCQTVSGGGKYRFSITDLYQVSEMKIGGALRNTGCLLHGVRDDGNGELLT